MRLSDDDLVEVLDALHAQRRQLDRLMTAFRRLGVRDGRLHVPDEPGPDGAAALPPAPPPQRGRILPGNRHLVEAREFVRLAAAPVTRVQVAEAIGVSPAYAYDLLAALRERAEVERLRPGRWRYVAAPGA